MTEFGKAVRKRLTELDMSQRELARRVGVADNTISRYLHDERDPSFTTAVKILKAVGITDLTRFQVSTGDGERCP